MIESTVARPRILVVEDDPEQSEQMERTLSDLGYEVVDRAPSGTLAVRAADRYHPDLVLMDLRLPGPLDGVGAARAICERDDVPMVFITGTSGEEELRRIMDAAPYGYVQKPVGRRQLKAAVELGLRRWRAERHHRQREQWLEGILQCHQDIVAVLDRSGVVEYVSPSVGAVLGLPPERHLGRDVLERCHPVDRPRIRRAMNTIVQNSGGRLQTEARFRDEAGDWRLLHIEGGIHRGTAGGGTSGNGKAQIRMVVHARDITRGRARERRLQASEERYRLLFRDSVAGAFQATLAGALTDANRALVEMLGYGSREELLRRSLGGLIPDAAMRVELLDQLRQGRDSFSDEVRLQTRDGTEIIGLLGASVTRLGNGDGPMVIGTVMDITQRKRMEAGLERMAYEDPLTGLVNRRAVYKHAARYLALAERRNTLLAVVYLDLAGFKEVNDRLGHDAGDAVLTEVARRLEAGARDRDVVCRMGGDEFVVLLPEVPGVDTAVEVAHRMERHLRSPIPAGGSSVEVRAEMGVALYPEDGSNLDALLRAADGALYRAKESRGTVEECRIVVTDRDG